MVMNEVKKVGSLDWFSMVLEVGFNPSSDDGMLVLTTDCD